MAKRQTRRSISVKGLTYQRVKSYCDAQGKSVSGYLEEVIHAKLDEVGEPMPIVLTNEAKAREQKPIRAEDIASAHFTF